MGLQGLSIGHLLVVLLVVVLVFGTKRLRTVGNDLGEALKGFRQGLRGGDEAEPDEARSQAIRPAASAEAASRENKTPAAH